MRHTRVTRSFTQIFYDPRQVFETLLEARSWIVVGILITVLAYFEGVLSDVHKFNQRDSEIQITRTQLIPKERAEEEKRAIEAGKYGRFSEVKVTPRDDDFVRIQSIRNKTLKDVILPFGSYAMIWWGFLGLWIMICLDAIYFQIVGKIMKLQMEFRDWLSFAIWSRVPMVCLYFIVTSVIGMLLDIRRAITGAHFLDVKSWIDIPNAGIPGVYEITFEFVGIGLIWVLGLQIIGFIVWSQRSTFLASVIVLAPTVAHYGAALIWLSAS